MTAVALRFDVPGAPCRIGWRARVVKLNDYTFHHWEELLQVDADGVEIDPQEAVERFLIGLEGTIIHLEYGCGCGQTFPEDPMIGVGLVLPDGTYVEEEFWWDEIDVAPSSRLLGSVR